MTTFDNLGLADSLLRAVRDEGYHTATPIQLQAIPPVLAGRDLMGCAQTGTGKTAAFALPTLHRLSTSVSKTAAANGNGAPRNGQRNGKHHDSFPRADRRPIRSLILAPTRELAAQIGESFATYGRFTGLRYTVVYGGVGQGPQVRALQNGVDILVATPGRLLDLMEQGHINLRHVEILILDEADQMLDMGFIVPLRRIVCVGAASTANADVLGHHAARDSQAGRRMAARSGARPSRPGRHADRAGRAVGVLRRAAAQAALAHALFAEHGVHADARVRPHQAWGRQDRQAI